MYKQLSVFILGTLLMLSCCAARADSSQTNRNGSAAQQLPKLIAKMQKDGAIKVLRRFDAPAGMAGYLLKEKRGYLVVYSRGGYVFSGALIDPDNHNLTAEYYALYVPKPKYANIAKKIEQHGTMITLGKNKTAPVLYVFEDPNCIFCYRFNKVVFPLVDQGKVRLKVVLVAFLKPDSLARATAILAAKDPAEAIRDNEAHYVTAREEGGYSAAKRPVQKFVAALHENRTLMNEAGFTGTPAIIYQAKNGKWNGIGGMPSTTVLNKIIDEDMGGVK